MMLPLVFNPGVPFFLSTRRTMKKSTTNYLLLVIVLAVVAAFAYLMVRPSLVQRKIDMNIQKVNARFTPEESIDLSMAMKMTTHEAPQMLNPPEPVRPLLLFPPTDEDLAKLSGV